MTKNTGMVLGLLAAPLPMVLLTVAILVVTVDLSASFFGFLLLAYALVLVPLGLAHGIAHWMRSRRLLVYVGMMFAITFVAALSGWQLLEFSADSSLSIELSDGVEQPVPLPVAGVLVAALVGTLEAACITLFWLFAIRGRQPGEING